MADVHGLESRGMKWWRLLLAVSMFLWGFWYPPDILGGRLVFKSAELAEDRAWWRDHLSLRSAQGLCTGTGGATPRPGHLSGSGPM